MKPDYDEIEAQAASFLLRRTEPCWSDADQHELEAWLELSMAHKAAFWRLEAGFMKIDALARIADVERPQIRHGWRQGLIAASVALVAVVGAFMAWMAQHDRPTMDQPLEYATRYGGISDTILSDGSRVTLNANTLVKYAASVQTRTIWLARGEAFFDVAHDKRRPFIVKVGDQSVTVLGTKFAVEHRSKGMKISVLEGRVRINGTGNAVLTPGNVAIVDESSILVTRASEKQLSRLLSWREGLLIFEDTPLIDAANQFNRYNLRKIVILDAEAAKTRIGGSFQIANEARFVHILETAYGFTVTSDANEIRIASRSDK